MILFENKFYLIKNQCSITLKYPLQIMVKWIDQNCKSFVIMYEKQLKLKWMEVMKNKDK